MQARANGQMAVAQQDTQLQVIKLIHDDMIMFGLCHVVAQRQGDHAVIFGIAVDAGTGRERHDLVAFGDHRVDHPTKCRLILFLCHAQTFIKRRQFTHGDGDGFTSVDNALPVQQVMARIFHLARPHQEGRINARRHFRAGHAIALHQIEADGFAQHQAVNAVKHKVCQRIDARVLERSDRVADQVDRFFRHQRTERVVKLGHAIEIDEERTAHLNDRIIFCQAFGKGFQVRWHGKRLKDAAFAQMRHHDVRHQTVGNLTLKRTDQALA